MSATGTRRRTVDAKSRPFPRRRLALLREILDELQRPAIVLRARARELESTNKPLAKTVLYSADHLEAQASAVALAIARLT